MYVSTSTDITTTESFKPFNVFSGPLSQVGSRYFLLEFVWVPK
jgi:hypothetical protein